MPSPLFTYILVGPFSNQPAASSRPKRVADVRGPINGMAIWPPWVWPTRISDGS